MSAVPRLPVGRIECIQLTIFVELANKLVIDESITDTFSTRGSWIEITFWIFANRANEGYGLRRSSAKLLAAVSSSATPRAALNACLTFALFCPPRQSARASRSACTTFATTSRLFDRKPLETISPPPKAAYVWRIIFQEDCKPFGRQFATLRG